MPPAAPTTAASSAYFPALTGLRAVAAYLVFLLHFRPLAWHEGLVNRICEQFYLGVSLFFVLSGFVIAHRYQRSVQLNWGWWRAYFWRRAARIYPTYLLLNTSVLARLYWPLPAGKVGNSLLLIFLSESLLRGFSTTLKYVGLPQGWSLTPEECFYFSVPLLLVLWRGRGRRGAAAFVAVVVASGLLLTYLCHGRPAVHGFFDSYHQLVNFTFFGRVLEFTLGVGLARWWQARPAPAAPPRAPRPWRTGAGVLGMGLVVGLLAAIDSPKPLYQGTVYPSAIALNNLAFPLAITLLLAGLLAEPSWLRRWLALPLMQALGRSSYFFYLLHVGLLSIWWRGTFGWGRHVGWQFVATVVLAEIGYRAFEQPVHRWLLARLGQRPSAMAK